MGDFQLNAALRETPEYRKAYEQTAARAIEAGQEEVKRTLRSLSVAEFLALDLKPREMVLDPIIPTQGLVMVHAVRGVGKTYVGIGGGYATAAKGTFLRWTAPKPRRVLFVDGELPAATLQERIARQVQGVEVEPPDPGYFRIITPDLQEQGIPDLSLPEGQQAIEEHLGDVDLLILDNLSTLCRSGKENEAESWQPLQDWLLSLRRHGLSVLLFHHGGKGGTQRGTSKREDILDTVICLRRPADYDPEQGARFEVHYEKARGLYGPAAAPFEAKLTMENGSPVWTCTDIEVAVTERVAEFLQEGLSQRTIAKELGVSLGTVNTHVKRAKQRGLVK